ncbi:MAG TPA: TIM barrel protein [Bryobacteraceae bacterium]|nr:TIM barrel protein [Bryobacteraceae bacterium]
MLRRTLLRAPALAAFAQAKPPGFKLSVRVEPLFPGMPLSRQIERVAEAGYQGFEFGDWRVQNAAEITKTKNRLGVECACIVGNRGVNPVGMGLCDPRERSGFLTEIKASADAARRFETTRLVVLTGNRIPHMPREQQHASIVEGLKRAHDIVAPLGITLIVEVINTLAEVEPLNPRTNHLNYYLNYTREAFEIIREVSSPFVKVLFDLYHVQIMEGNLIDTIRKNIQAIDHFHVGDVPGRHEPGTGEIHHGNVFQAIRDTGYKNFVAMEYIPSKDAMATLAEVRSLPGIRER